mmetsp:Transcript_19503/g.35301  ORF Transcript_19503/g.35301 Transcript_19503/m.35301 type:complete len:95 (+) Transcript_19503:305-589(+)
MHSGTNGQPDARCKRRPMPKETFVSNFRRCIEVAGASDARKMPYQLVEGLGGRVAWHRAAWEVDWMVCAPDFFGNVSSEANGDLCRKSGAQIQH